MNATLHHCSLWETAPQRTLTLLVLIKRENVLLLLGVNENSAKCYLYSNRCCALIRSLICSCTLYTMTLRGHLKSRANAEAKD